MKLLGLQLGAGSQGALARRPSVRARLRRQAVQPADRFVLGAPTDARRAARPVVGRGNRVRAPSAALRDSFIDGRLNAGRVSTAPGAVSQSLQWPLAVMTATISERLDARPRTFDAAGFLASLDPAYRPDGRTIFLGDKPNWILSPRIEL